MALGLGAVSAVDIVMSHWPNHACDGRDNGLSVLAREQTMMSLLDGAYEIVEMWKATVPSQFVWKENWLRKVRELCPQL